jgi:hypothetical protein
MLRRSKVIEWTIRPSMRCGRSTPRGACSRLTTRH